MHIPESKMQSSAGQDGAAFPQPDASPERPRIGAVTVDDALLETPDFAREPGYVELKERLEKSRELAASLEENSPFLNERELGLVLETGLRNSALDALLIATRDGLVVAEASRGHIDEILSIIGSLVEDTAARAEAEGVVRAIDEMLLRGADGELVAVRYFPQTGQKFFLLAYARNRCAYRRETNRIIRRCGPMLAEFS